MCVSLCVYVCMYVCLCGLLGVWVGGRFDATRLESPRGRLNNPGIPQMLVMRRVGDGKRLTLPFAFKNLKVVLIKWPLAVTNFQLLWKSKSD